MNEKIKKHVMAYNQKEDFGVTDEDIMRTIEEAKEIWSGKEHRHWIEYDAVVEIDGMFIQFVAAKGAGDQGVYDAGWEFDSSTIHEVKPKKIETITYVSV